MSEERDPRISDIFSYFEPYTSLRTGRTVGRKIGVIQEIFCGKHLISSQVVQDSLIYEPRLPGISGATHKVEFVLFQPLEVVCLSVGDHIEMRASRANLSVKLLNINEITLKLDFRQG